MKVIGIVNREKVLVTIEKWEFEQLTGVANITDLSVYPDRAFDIAAPVQKALKLLTLRDRLKQAEQTLSALAEMCKTELPLYSEIEALNQADGDASKTKE